MTVKQLIDKLEQFEDDADVLVIDDDNGEEFDIKSVHQEFRESHKDEKQHAIVIINLELD